MQPYDNTHYFLQLHDLTERPTQARNYYISVRIIHIYLCQPPQSKTKHIQGARPGPSSNEEHNNPTYYY